jgi:hypothetical protein
LLGEQVLQVLLAQVRQRFDGISVARRLQNAVGGLAAHVAHLRFE